IPVWAKVHSIVVALAEQSTREHDIRKLTDELRQLWLAARRSQPRPGDADNGADRYEPVLRELPPPHPLPVRPPAVTVPALVVAPRPLFTANSGGTPPASDRIVGGLPDRNPYFTGREILLDRMRDELVTHPHSPLVLY